MDRGDGFLNIPLKKFYKKILVFFKKGVSKKFYKKILVFLKKGG
jgi:hypothetical protein